ncbi:EcsC family protein [Wenxinia saemankumensis]|uniref:EcsC protein family protein n=1 Tax=Wenxinia saemankumensis TaxID=1447782 RepID=A0A1M6GWH4_9RHOB|nr:EcsC family protein [Wenxinia saemankumensis]SHJ14328.1 EcsC protein family protein [Wenxinia saemankumensis]
MSDPESRPLRDVNPDHPPAPLTEAARTEIAGLARRQRAANGVVMRVISLAGKQVEDGMKFLPKGARGQIEGAARSALSRAYDAAAASRRGPLAARVGTDWHHRALGTVSGALGGAGGLPTVLAEIPVTTAVIFRAVQGVAEAHGEDPTAEATRAECLRVFGAGLPGEADDGIDTSFIGARLGLTGPAIHTLIGRVAPRFAAVLGQKLAAGAVPLVGAVAGAGINYAFVDYYVELAHVHFGLRELIREHGEAQVLDAFHAELARASAPVTRA